MQQNPCLILKSLIFGPRSEAYWSPCSIPSVKKSYLAYTCHGSGQKKRPIEGKIPCPSIAIRSCWCSWWWLRMVWRVINLQIRICTIGCWFYTACRKVSWTCLKALECINYQSLSSSRFHDISESPSVPWRFHGHRVVLCRFPAKKEKGDIELLQHIACLDVRPQTRTAKKKYQQKPQARTLKTSTHPFLRCWNMFHSSHSQVHSMNPWTKTRIWSPGPTFSVLKSWRAAASATGSSSDNLVPRIWQRYSELSKSPHFG